MLNIVNMVMMVIGYTVVVLIIVIILHDCVWVWLMKTTCPWCKKAINCNKGGSVEKPEGKKYSYCRCQCGGEYYHYSVVSYTQDPESIKKYSPQTTEESHVAIFFALAMITGLLTIIRVIIPIVYLPTSLFFGAMMGAVLLLVAPRIVAGCLNILSRLLYGV